MSVSPLLEALLFAAAEPVSVKRLAALAGLEEEKVRQGLDALAARLDEGGSGIQLLRHGQQAELVTRPEFAEAVREAARMEIQGELTRPSLEALAILAYRGPMTRPELEQIRGVQSALILRNLMLRGLVETKEDTRLGQPIYAATTDFVKYLGAARLEDLPDYEALRGHSVVEQALKELEPSDEEPSATLKV